MTSLSPLTDGSENRSPRETDWRLFQRLIPYALRSKRLLAVSIFLLVPLSVSGAIQPIVIGQAISLIRSEPTYKFLQGMPLSQGLNFLGVLLL
ncbi:MAG TPA: ABC transporter ATP-binding protein, partial [Kamptonema sp.]|nr:ABC transporter ATP-binding protein [Kamptonema sp.]